MRSPVRVAHLTSAHDRSDTRIFLKMCRSLAAAGHEVFLVVADGLGPAEKDGVKIVDVEPSRGRIDRMLGTTRRVLKEALALDADLYHFHDPELLPAGLILKRRGKRVIYDSHEDLPRDILSKTYLHPGLRRAIAGAADLFERYASRRLDAVAAATPVIRDKFSGFGVHSVDINNFPMLGELETKAPWSGRAPEVCYVGGIGAARGIVEIVAAMALCGPGSRLNLVGQFSEKPVEDQVRQSEGWARVNEFGFLSRPEIAAVLARSMAGLVTLHPTPAYLDALPVKLFEYMSAGLPVIASDFPVWRGIVEGAGCGLLVDPEDPAAIAAAVQWFLDHPGEAEAMGERGRQAIQERYNWQHEAAKLADLYATVLGSGARGER